ncbi:uncharacterized protein A1O5_06319 [Cladophialophora psammophila CBS 110553]|uniref:Uncharacterized protein n=1 Tax=Cladophialophora psammophila CBS 110553 TaxID=1182543 RepID=W9X000_9EURO|nr:uncharacterized protein A1O5_06319 [Cladophialophora psammophila CBS 110553]EXJ70251.1 hypothetical protein A1O5_06319 [Cladophialophora psammophila CBS 110553]
MAPITAVWMNGINNRHFQPIPTHSHSANVQSSAPQLAAIFKSQVATVQPSTVEYPKNHFLGIPQELRDAIVAFLIHSQHAIGARPSTGCEIFHFVCRQTYHESCRCRNSQATVLVPANRAKEFLMTTLNINTIKSNVSKRVKTLFLEIPHNSHSNVFLQMAEVLRRSTQLEELHLFGVGVDGYGVKTSSTTHPCGKHDISIVPWVRRLAIDGQQYQRRLALVNSIPWLAKLRVLVLDNLNLPLLQAHVLKNKPRLQKLYIAADPRTVLHGEYINICQAVGNLIFPVHEQAPPVRELRVDSNSIFSTSRVTIKMATTLESLELVIPDMEFQVHTNKINFYQEATFLLHGLHIAKRLRKLKVCVHGTLSEESYHYANFMGALKDCVSRMESLQVIELHLHSQSPWFAREFIIAVPRSVTRLFLTDLFISRDVVDLSAFIGEKTKTPLQDSIETKEAYAIGEDLQRKDYIQFSDNQLAFVGYEYDVFLGRSAAKQTKDMFKFLKLNGRMLDKERNRHLAPLKGKHIPFKQSGVREYSMTAKAAWKAKVTKYSKELVNCGLDDNEYFGMEDVAEALFEDEPVAKGGRYSYPAVYEVEPEFKFSNHWLSK